MDENKITHRLHNVRVCNQTKQASADCVKLYAKERRGSIVVSTSPSFGVRSSDQACYIISCEHLALNIIRDRVSLVGRGGSLWFDRCFETWASSFTPH